MMLASRRTDEKVFFGWWIVLVSGIGLFMGYGAIYNYTFGVLTSPIGREFDWSRFAVSLGYSLSLVAYSVVAPFVGKLVDAWGARRVIVPSLVLFAAGLMGFSFLSANLWHFYALNIALGVLGCGSAIVPYSKVISHWFDRRRGLALGLASIGVGVSSFMMPSVAFALISDAGWRAAYLWIGLMVLVVTVPVGLFLKENPSMLGLWPDGDVRSQPVGGKALSAAPGMTGWEALQSRTFWLLFAAVLFVAMSVIGCLIQLVPILTERGISPQAAAFAASLLGGAVMPGRIVSGLLMDRFFAPTVAMVFFACAGLGVFVLWTGSGGAWVFVAAFLVGLGMGAEGETIAYLVSRYFGLRAFSEIYGYALISFAMGGVIGPPLMGIAFDITGSYSQALGVLLVSIVVGLTLMRKLGPYPKWETDEVPLS